MFPRNVIILSAICCVATACTAGDRSDVTTIQEEPAMQLAPDFQGIDSWLNSPPLTMPELRGKVVLVEFWTYSCINCIHVTPYVKKWHDTYKGQGLVVVGVHTPEYDEEKDLGNLEEALRRLGISYPVAQDNRYKTWDAFGNRYWPAFYLIDQNGRIVYHHYGEGNYPTTERQIQRLLTNSKPIPKE